MEKKGILYVVSTPIGNLKDITYRAVEILSNTEYIACEDTRTVKNVLNLTKEVEKKDKFLISYFEGNEMIRIPQIINLLLNGSDVALVSESGTPTISDPGYKLVRECIEKDIKVEAIPGPTAMISALVSSGLPTDKFLFLGFLPKKEGHRKSLLEKVKEMPVSSSVIFYESPHRIIKSLGELFEIFGDIEVVLARELTKIHEEVRKDKIATFLEYYKKSKPRGEYVVLFHL